MNRPLASYPLRLLEGQGIRGIAANLHHLPGTVREALGPGLHYVEEPAILGTGGAVRNLRSWLEGGPCVVANGDTLAELDLAEALSVHRASGVQATLLAEDRDPRPEFSAVWTGVEGGLLGFGLEAPAPDARPCHFAGVHILEETFLKALPARQAFCLHREGYLPFQASGGKVRVWAGARDVRDVGTPERYLALHAELLGDPARAARLRGSPLPPERGAGLFMDAQCRIASGARLLPPVLLEGVRVGSGTTVGPGVVAGPGASFGPDVRLSGSVAWAGSALPAGFSGEGIVVLPSSGRAAP
jgi:NDP-sugar pyrophosphorylase family protein